MRSKKKKSEGEHSPFAGFVSYLTRFINFVTFPLMMLCSQNGWKC